MIFFAESYFGIKSAVMPKVCVIIGFGLGVGEALLDRFVRSRYEVAIVARTQSRLDDAAAAYTAKGHNVKGFSCDLSQPTAIQETLAAIISEFGPINVVIYNACNGVLPFTATPAEIQAATNVNIVSMHAAFNYLLPLWQADGGGTFLLSGGGLSVNGAYSVPFSLQFGAASKSYFKNFAESAHATFNTASIHVCCMTISGLVYGGDTITAADPDPEASALWRMKLGNAYVHAAEQPQEEWTDNVTISP